MGDTPRQGELDLTTGAEPPVRPSSEPVQAGLFPDDSVPDELVGYRGPSACQIAGITYRQLDYWARTSLVVPSIRSAAGSGSQRLYSFKDILVLKIVKRLLDTGISLHNIRVAVDHLRQRGVQDLANITLFSDGTTVYECTSAEEVVDLLQGGQGVFGIAVSGAMRELTGVTPTSRASAPMAARRSRRPRTSWRRVARAATARSADAPTHHIPGRAVEFAAHRPVRESSVIASHGRRRSNTSPSTSQAPRTAPGHDASGKRRRQAPAHGERLARSWAESLRRPIGSTTEGEGQ